MRECGDRSINNNGNDYFVWKREIDWILQLSLHSVLSYQAISWEQSDNDFKLTIILFEAWNNDDFRRLHKLMWSSFL